MVGLARGKGAVDRQGVAGPEQGVEPLLGAEIVRFHGATRRIAPPAHRVRRVYQTHYFGQ